MVITPGIFILSLRFWMYKVSEAFSSGAGSVSGGTATGCCSGCGGAVDMVEVVAGYRNRSRRSPELESRLLICFLLDQRVKVPTGVSSEMAQDEGEDEDYFAHFEDLRFTEDDLAQIDRIYEGGFYAPVSEPALPLSESKGEARVTIEVEQKLQPVPKVVPPPTSSPRSPVSEPPYDAFRSGKSLSVSDLTGPLWCVDCDKTVEFHAFITP